MILDVTYNLPQALAYSIRVKGLANPVVPTLGVLTVVIVRQPVTVHMQSVLRE
jgi:hypothetical protein